MRALRSKIIFGVFIIISFFVFSNIADAKIFEVSTSAQLSTYLAEAESNDEDDLFKIKKGTYLGNFVYASFEEHSLSFEGGYQADFITRDVDPANTVLDAGGSGAVLVLSAPDVAANFVVDGLTIQNGDVSLHGGGGIYITTDRGNVTISNNIISTNSVQSSHPGGGIYIYGSIAVLLSDNMTSDNSSGGLGGGVYFSNNVEVNMSNNIIANNSSNDGGGVYSENSQSVTLNNNQIFGNVGGYAGGGGVIDASYTLLENNTISNNSSRVGGGIWLTGNPAILKNNRISDNVASDTGGGVYSRGNPSIITNNVISNNKCIDRGGGGIVAYGDGFVDVINNIITNNEASYGGGVEIGTPEILNMINNTIANNVADDKGGGIYVWLHEDNGELANIYNNIILNNRVNNNALNGGDIYIDNDHNNNYIPSPVYLYNNDFDHRKPEGIYIQVDIPIHSSNLDNVDPLFVDPANDDYHLSAGSPCIDVGNNSAPELPTTDKDGNPRKVGSAVDIGAYEFQGFVTPLAAFMASPLVGVAPLTVEFFDESTGSIDSYYWDFGDGNDSTLQNPTNTYNVAGTFSVSLTVTGDSVSDTETKTDYITVVSPDAPDLSCKAKEFHSYEFGQKIVVKLQVENSGNTKANPFDVAFYLSENGITQDELLELDTVNGGLNSQHTKVVSLRYESGISLSGKYIIAVIDPDGRVLELDETNNYFSIRIP